MRVVVHADGGPSIGAGHLVRMRVLAEALFAAGCTVDCVACAHPHSPVTWAWAGLPHRLVPPAPPAAVIDDAGPADWVVVDHYGYLPSVRSSAARILVVDDVPGTRELAAATVILNQNLGVSARDYPAQALCGAEYALVRAPFAARAPHPDAGPILILPGGTDAAKIGMPLATMLTAAGHDVVLIGAQVHAPRVTSRQKLAAAELAVVMASCRAGVFACGSAVYEALASGLPLIAVTVADNQQRLADGLAALGVPVVAKTELAEVAPRLAQACAPPVVDGLGAQRIVAVMRQICMEDQT